MTPDEVRYYRRYSAWCAVAAAIFAGISWRFGAHFPLWWALGCCTLALFYLAVAQWWRGPARSVTRALSMTFAMIYVVIMVWKLVK